MTDDIDADLMAAIDQAGATVARLEERVDSLTSDLDTARTELTTLATRVARLRTDTGHLAPPAPKRANTRQHVPDPARPST